MPRYNSLSSKILIGSTKIGVSLTSAPTGTLKILLAGGENAPGYVTVVKNDLQTAAALYPGLTLNITEYAVSGGTIPTVTVGQYDVIFFWTDYSLNWSSSLDTHNANNGGLVTAQFHGSVPVTGITSNIMPTVPNTGGQSGAALTWPSPPYTHPIANGFDSSTQRVTSFNSGPNFSATNPTLNSGATTVVISTAGATLPFVIVKDNTAPTGRTAYLNFYPPSSGPGGYSGGWSPTTYPHGGLLMLNTLLWAARRI
jgi:hypothetical protein